jgi:hypothetical protein
VGYSGSDSLGDPTHGVSTLEHLCTLSAITDRILSDLYAENRFGKDSKELFRISQSLHADLIAWRKSVPAHLSFQFDESGKLDTSSGSVALPHTMCLMQVEILLLLRFSLTKMAG